jgi:hypothetical protein
MWLMSELQLSACVIAQLSFNNHRRAARPVGGVGRAARDLGSLWPGPQ